MNAPEVLEGLRKLDDRYPALNATEMVLRVVTKDLTPSELEEFLRSTQGLDQVNASNVRSELDRIILKRLSTLPPAPSVPPSASSPVAGAAPGGIQLPSHGFEHQEDADEIAKHREAVGAMQTKPVPDANAVASGIAKDLGLTFPDPNLERRFTTIAVLAMKGIRKSFDTRDLLTRSPKIGGMGFAPEVSEKLLAAFESHAGELGAVASVSVPSITPPAMTPVAPAPKIRPGLPSAPTVPLRSAPARSIPPMAVPVPPPNLPVPPQPPARPATQPVPLRPAVPSAPAAPAPVAARPAATLAMPERAVRTTGRPMVADVRKPKRTVGPVDELNLLTVDDLRRLDRDPEVALTKVWSKLQGLSQESFALYADGIKAWRHSPLYQLYLTMGTQSMASGRAVDEVANARRIANQPTLTPREFELVADFNRHLRL